VHRPSNPHTDTLLDPRGIGPTNTINRAELVAILHALTNTCATEATKTRVIATDSLCSLHWINRGLRRPQTLAHSKHFQLIERIVERLRDRASRGLRTSLVKVMAHTGVVGNEMADQMAKMAALQLAGTPPCCQTSTAVASPSARAELVAIPHGNDPYTRLYSGWHIRRNTTNT